MTSSTMNLFITLSHISLLQDSDDGDSHFGLFASWTLPILCCLKINKRNKNTRSDRKMRSAERIAPHRQGKVTRSGSTFKLRVALPAGPS